MTDLAAIEGVSDLAGQVTLGPVLECFQGNDQHAEPRIPYINGAGAFHIRKLSRASEERPADLKPLTDQ